MTTMNACDIGECVVCNTERNAYAIHGMPLVQLCKCGFKMRAYTSGWMCENPDCNPKPLYPSFIIEVNP